MFAALARFSYRFRWPVLVGFLLLLTVAGSAGGGAFAALDPCGCVHQTAESFEAREQIRDALGVGEADLFALYTVSGGSVEDPAVRDAVTVAIGRAAADPAVARAVSFYTTGAPH